MVVVPPSELNPGRTAARWLRSELWRKSNRKSIGLQKSQSYMGQSCSNLARLGSSTEAWTTVLVLRGTAMRLHLGERFVHVTEKPNSVGNQVRIPVAFMPLNQLPLALDP
jgi:hypothetical protein